MKTLALLVVVVAVVPGCHTRMGTCGGGGWDRATLVTLESVDEVEGSPANGTPILAFPTPVYPWEMVRAGIAGEVVARFTVGPDGVVRKVTIVRSTQEEFEMAVIVAGERSRFYEFFVLGSKERKGVIVDCTIRFAFDES